MTTSQTGDTHKDFWGEFFCGEDTLNRRYQTADETISGGTDVIVVCHGIYEAQDPMASARQYQTKG